VELLKDDGLGLDLADLLSNDPLGHFLDDCETLLDYLDGLAVAHEFGFMFNDGGVRDFADKVVGAVEVVETVERRNSTVVVEGVATSNKLVVEGDSRDSSGEGRDDGNFSEFGEHV